MIYNQLASLILIFDQLSVIYLYVSVKITYIQNSETII